jgi:hypothetical protein
LVEEGITWFSKPSKLVIEECRTAWETNKRWILRWTNSTVRKRKQVSPLRKRQHIFAFHRQRNATANRFLLSSSHLEQNIPLKKKKFPLKKSQAKLVPFQDPLLDATHGDKLQFLNAHDTENLLQPLQTKCTLPPYPCMGTSFLMVVPPSYTH